MFHKRIIKQDISTVENQETMNIEIVDLVYRLRERARIRRQISTRKSVQEGKPDRISDILEEAANMIESLEIENKRLASDQQRKL